MNGFALTWKLARRELRGGVRGFRILIACLALGVASIAAVGTVSEAIVAGLRADGRALLGGDVDLRLLHRTTTIEQDTYIAERALAVSRTTEMRAMTRPEERRDRRAMIELKAVDDAYPLVGDVELVPDVALDEALARRGGTWGAVAEATLLARLGAAVGDRLRVGEATVEVRAVIEREPDRVASVFNFGPRLMVAVDALPETGLVQPGSLIRYHTRIAVPEETGVVAWIEDLKATFPKAGWRIRDTGGAAPGLARFIERMTLFLGFVGLTALLVGGIGVANAVGSYLDSKTATIATLKCLGAPGRLVFRTYLLQIAVLSAIGIVIGLALGVALPTAVLLAVGNLLPVRTEIAVYPLPMVLAAAFGVLVALTFALWPLARARGVSAASLFRTVVAPTRAKVRARDIAAVGAGAVALAALTLATANDRYFAYWFVGGAAATLLLLRLGATAIMALAARLPRPRNTVWRLALANLHRPGTPTPNVVLSLGTGLSVLVAVALIEANLSNQISERLPKQAPAFFFIDIQSGQVDAFDAAVRSVDGAGELQRVPSLRGRIVRIAGVPVEQAKVAPEAAWAVRGDRGLTYAVAKPARAKVIAGQWWPSDYDGPPIVSLDAGIARGFGVGVGDTITLNILGREITVLIASLREIDWRSVPFDFVFIFAPGALEGASHTHIAAVAAPPEAEDAIEAAVTDRFANVTAIRVRDALEAVNEMLSGIGHAVRSTAPITLVAGALVLAGAIAAGRQRRIYDSVVFKVLGATRGRIVRAFIIEYGLMGLVTGIIAAVIGTTTAWAVIVFLMDSEWVFRPAVVAVTAVVCILITQAMGFAGTWRALSEKAAPHLRNE